MLPDSRMPRRFPTMRMATKATQSSTRYACIAEAALTMESTPLATDTATVRT